MEKMKPLEYILKETMGNKRTLGDLIKEEGMWDVKAYICSNMKKLRAMINEVDAEVDAEMKTPTVQETLSEIVIKLAKLQNNIKAVYQKTEQLGCSCQKAFLQIREAMTTLREELSEASGTLIEGTFFD